MTMKTIKLILPVAALSACSVLADSRTMSFNSEVRVLPAPGEVKIDGLDGDWDLSAGILSYNDPKVAARHSIWTHMMWDAKGLYLLGRYRDDSPFVNNAVKGIDFSKSWRGDCFQARVIFDDRTPDEHQMHIDLYYSRNDGRGYIAVKHGGLKDRPPYDGTGPTRPDQLAKWGNDMTAKGGRIAYAPWADGQGYNMEVFMPWTFLRTGGEPLKPGESFVFGLEAFWGNRSGLNNIHRLADCIRDESVNRIFMFRAREGWGRGLICDRGNLDVTERQKALLAERLKNFFDFHTDGSVKIAYDLPEDRDVTIAIDDANGVRVRNLFGEYPREKGRVEDFWDCMDDNGNPVKPGAYTATVVHHRPLGLKFYTSLYNAATPPWQTDGPFRLWGANHGHPTSVATDGRHTVLLFTGTEGMSGLQLLDDDGRVVWADKMECQDGTMDDTYVYALSRCAWQSVVLLQRNRLSDGKVEPFMGESRLPFKTIVKEGWTNANDYSTLALAHGRLWALMPGFRFVVADPKSGDVLKDAADDGRYLALTDRNGRLYALTSDARVVVLDANGGIAREVFRATGLVKPVRLGVDLGEERFAISDVDLKQVFVFDAKGGRLGVVGETYEGSHRPAGRFVETNLVRPIGADFDRNGKLWIAEGSSDCKRVTRWSENYELEDQFWGAADYGATRAFPIVADATRFIAHGIEFAVDRHPDPYNRKTNERPLLNQPHLAHTRGLVYRLNGRDYACAAPGHGRSSPLEIFIRGDDGIFRPVLRITFTNRVRRNGRWVSETGKAWCDLNGNHVEDPGETQPFDAAFSYWSNGWVRPDLTILTTDNKLLAPTGFTDRGVPLYDFAHPATTGDGKPYAQSRTCTGSPVIDRAGNVSDGLSYVTPDGRRGTYPNRWGRHDAPAARRGCLIAPFRVNGVVEDVPGVGSALALGGDRGQWFILSMDGLYLGAICQDAKGDLVLDETYIGQESFGGFFWRDQATGRTLVQVGQCGYSILELTNLDTTVKETQRLTVSAADIAASERILQAKAVKSVEESALVAVNNVLRLPVKAPAALLGTDTTLIPGATDTMVVEEGNPERWFRASVAHDRATLAVAFQVADPSPWKNGESRFTHLFAGGDAVDLKLDVPGVGPVRILAAPMDGKPTAVFWRKRSPEKGREITYSVNNNMTNAESFDEVRLLKCATVDVNVAGQTYSVLLRVPLADVALDGLKPGPLKGTVGVVYSNPAGNNRIARVYWHDKQTGLVSDIPSESRLNLRNFGEMEWR